MQSSNNYTINYKIIPQGVRCYLDIVQMNIGPFEILTMEIYNNISGHKNDYIFYKEKDFKPRRSPGYYLHNKNTESVLLRIDEDEKTIRIGNIVVDLDDIRYVDFLEKYFIALRDVFNNSQESLEELTKCEKMVIDIILKYYNIDKIDKIRN